MFGDVIVPVKGGKRRGIRGRRGTGKSIEPRWGEKMCLRRSMIRWIFNENVVKYGRMRLGDL